MAEVELPLCEGGKTLNSVPMEPITFKGDTSMGSAGVGGGNYLRISHDHAGLGANVEFAANPDGRYGHYHNLFWLLFSWSIKSFPISKGTILLRSFLQLPSL